MTSFHKNRIFVKTRKVMGNTDVAHYRGQLATTLSSFCSAKTRSSKIGTGRQSIYNICILNDCKLTFEFFKNYIFEKRRQFLNRILVRWSTRVCMLTVHLAQLAYKHRWADNRRLPCHHQGWRADKTLSSF